MHNRVTTIPNTPGDRATHGSIPDQGDNYVLRGCSLTYSAGRLAIGAGTMTLTHGDEVFAVAVDEQTQQLASGSEDIYVDVESDGPDASVVVQSSAPSSPYLQIGSVDADEGTTTEANRTPEYESISTGSATIGNVGPVTGAFGDTGDEIPMYAESCTQDGSETVTSTSYTSLDGSVNVVQIPAPALADITGFNTIHLRILYNLNNAGDNDTAYIRLQGEPTTEVSIDQPTFSVGWTPPLEIQSNNTISDYRPEMRTDNGNEIELYRGTIVALGVVG